MAVDIIARGMITNYTAGTNINFTENDDGTVVISASGEVSSEDTVARDMINNHTINKENPHKVTAEQIGLDNVDNTSDIDKPVSTATQQALDKKAEKTHTHNKSDITDFPNSLPANGGNADTVDGYHVSDTTLSVDGSYFNDFARIDIDSKTIKNYDASQLQVGYATKAENANTVNNHTVNSDVPANALFTDTVYDDTEIDNRVKKNTNDISQLFDITKGGKELTGNSSYTLENTVDYPLIGLNLYGKSAQNGTPTPENPVDIVSVGDSGFDIISKNDTHFNILSVRDNGGEIITKQPVSTAVKVGNRVTFTVAATGTGLKYLWQWSADGTTWKNTSNKTATYSTTASESFNGYKYRCVITDNSGNSETSNEVTLYVVSDDCEINTASITSSLPLCGIPVSSGGNYTDSNGQQWICDELIYNADGTGKITKRTAKIDSYNSEDISTPYISTTGSLTTGATVVYALAAPQEIELTAAEMTALRQLQTFNGTTSISNNNGAEMSVKYCTNKALSEFVYPVTMGLQKQIDELRAAILSIGGNV